MKTRLIINNYNKKLGHDNYYIERHFPGIEETYDPRDYKDDNEEEIITEENISNIKLQLKQCEKDYNNLYKLYISLLKKSKDKKLKYDSKENVECSRLQMELYKLEMYYENLLITYSKSFNTISPYDNIYINNLKGNFEMTKNNYLEK